MNTKCVSVCLVALSIGATYARAGIEGLAFRIPSGANVLYVINTEKIFASPLAKKEGWRAEQQQAFEAGVSVLPPGARSCVIAGKLDLEFFHPIWEVSMFDLVSAPNIVELAASRGGDVDRIDQRDAARLNDDTYVVRFNDQMAGIMRPAQRQEVANWLRSTSSSGSKPKLSDYLLESLSFATKNETPIIVAMDLTHTISPDLAQKRLMDMQALKGATLDITKEAKALSSVRGITLGITIKDRVFGKIKVDFSEEVSLDAEMSKKILLEVLASHGAMINEFDTWKPGKSGKQFTLGGYLYPSGLRRVLSILEIPDSLKKPQAEAGGQSLADSEQLAILASKAYFKAIEGYLKDLRRDYHQANGWGQVGAWIGRYARKIDQLSMVNVDPEMLDYGAYVTDSMRNASDNLRGLAGRSKVSESNVENSYRTYSRWGAYGGYASATFNDYKADQRNRTRVRTQERISSTTSAREVFQEIDRATGDIRRKMAEKYKEDF